MYLVEITEINEVEGVKREYERLADTGNSRDGGPVYGYVEQKVMDSKKTTLLKQEIEIIDISAVIKAVNGLK